MKDIPSQVLTKMAASEAKPTVLYILELSGQTLRFAASPENITFPSGGYTYTAWEIHFSSLKQTVNNQIERIKIKFDNTNRSMEAYANAEDFAGKTITIIKVFRDLTGDSTYYEEIFKGVMERPGKKGTWLEVPATQGKSLSHTSQSRLYAVPCRHKFGDAQCNQDGLADLDTLKAEGTADSGSALTLVDSALTQADDYWNYGTITITKGSDIEIRQVKDFVASTDTISWEIPISFAVDSICTYTVVKGCDHTWYGCQGLKSDGETLSLIHI